MAGVDLPILTFPGFGRFLQGRPCQDLPALVQRLYGICPVSHHLASAKALDQLAGVRHLPPAADRLRRLLHLGQTLQAHALYGMHLAMPDQLFGACAGEARERLQGLARACPDLTATSVRLRQFGRDVIRMLTGRRTHGTLAVAGGVARGLAEEDRATLLQQAPGCIQAGQSLAELARDLWFAAEGVHQVFGRVPANDLSLCSAEGALDLYGGGLRATGGDGRVLFDHVAPAQYEDHLTVGTRPGSAMMFPFLTALGEGAGWYRVGPLARLNNSSAIATPLAEAERRSFRAAGGGGPMHASLASHWARMIELLHAAEGIQELLEDPELRGTDLVATGERAREGIGIVEAPRGTLIHQYRTDDDGRITAAQVVVSTSHNHEAMVQAVLQVALGHLEGGQVTLGLLGHLERVLRAFDPCLACAGHPLGAMPMAVELVDGDGKQVDALARS